MDENNDANTQISFDERFVKAYIGKKADKMYSSVKNHGINLLALLFGVFYYTYRKMYLVSFAVFLGVLVLGLIPGINSISVVFGWLVGLRFCPLYKWDITRKLRKVKKENNNLSEGELIALASKMGGTSLLGLVAAIATFTALVLLLTI
jgi:hypothetical protein